MKKQQTKDLAISIILPLAMMIASCSSGEEITTGSDRFSEWDISLLSSTSRATIADLEGGFLVHATSGSSPTSFMIQGDTYKMGSDDWEWADDASYSWPSESDGYPMSFYAYYLKDVYTVSDSDDGSTLSVDVTVKDSGNQVDILSAQTQTSTRPVGGLLSLEFNHIMSRVDIDVVASEKSLIHLQSVDFVGVDDTNNYDMINTAWGDDTSIGGDGTEVSYKYLSLANPAIMITNGDESITGSVTEVTSTFGSLYLMPQTLTPWDTSTTLADARVEIVFRSTYIVDEADSDDDQIGYTYASDYPKYNDASGVGATDPLFIKIAVPLISTDGGYDWELGSSYDYTITLGAYNTNNGYFASEYYYDRNGNPTSFEIINAEVGDEVTPGDICFTVTLTDWNPKESVELAELSDTE